MVYQQLKLFNLKLKLNQLREKINQKRMNYVRRLIQDKEATAEERQAALDKINEFMKSSHDRYYE